MPKQKLLHDSVESRCIGVLLEKCRMPAVSCGQCWFGTDKGEPTLVKIAVFSRIETDANRKQWGVRRKSRIV